MILSSNKDRRLTFDMCCRLQFPVCFQVEPKDCKSNKRDTFSSETLPATFAVDSPIEQYKSRKVLPWDANLKWLSDFLWKLGAPQGVSDIGLCHCLWVDSTRTLSVRKLEKEVAAEYWHGSRCWEFRWTFETPKKILFFSLVYIYISYTLTLYLPSRQLQPLAHLERRWIKLRWGQRK